MNEDFEEISYTEYRGYIILFSAINLDTPEPIIKYQIFISQDSYEKGEYLYDSYLDICLYNFEDSLRLAKEWIDFHETFSY